MTAIERLQTAVRTLPEALARLSDAEAGHRPSPQRWSKKEVLGHLIDSASNNHQRFVRALVAGKLEFPRYEQDEWVRVQQYQHARWMDLIDLWRAYNVHLLHVIASMPETGRQATCRVGDGPELSLDALFEDYVRHLEHHVQKMLDG